MTARTLQLAAGVPRALIDSRSLLTAILLVLGLVEFVIHLAGLINHDSAWLLYGTGRMLEGARLYLDIVEVNPPLIFYLSVPPVLAARFLDLPVVDLFVLYIFALAAGSLALTREVMRSLPIEQAPLRRMLLVAAFFGLIVLPGPVLGQREHLVTILGLPYLVLVAVRSDGRDVSRRLAVVCGLAAGLAFSIKPPLLVVPALLELYLFIVRRPRILLFRPETLALAAAVSAYILSIVLFTPEYLTFIVPMAVMTYHAYETTWPIVLGRVETLLLPIAIALVFLTRDRRAASRLNDAFLITALCAYVFYVIERKGWQYQVYPVDAMLMLLVGVSLTRALWRHDTYTSREARWVRPAFLVVVLLVGLGVSAAARGNYRNSMTTVMTPYVRENAAHGGFAVLSAHVVWGFPLTVYAGVDWNMRLPALWMVPGLIRARATARGPAPELDRLERYVIDAVVEDFARHPPDVVLVDARQQKTYFGGLAFDYLAFFSRDPRFRQVWQDYRLDISEPWFQIYRRRANGSNRSE